MNKKQRHLKRKIELFQKKIQIASKILGDTIRQCKWHIVVRKGDSARCDICQMDFGWWCPKSEDHTCEYPDDSEYCKFCGEPSERK